METRLARIFERALCCSMLTGVLTQGCAGEPAATDPALGAGALTDDGQAALTPLSLVELAPAQPSARSSLSCPEGASSPIRASGLRPARKLDYLAVRQVLGSPSGDGPERWSRTDFQVVSEVGTPCATATSGACRQMVAYHPEPMRASSCVQLCSETSVVTTAGNEVRRWAGLEELRLLLGPIDTPDEALLLVEATGYDLACNDPARTTVHAVSDGFVVTATRLTALCAPVVTTRFTLHVSRQGALRILGSKEISRDESICIGRVPEGLSSTPQDQGRSALGDWLSRGAHLEAASVAAFERLADELEALGAPGALVQEARRAAEDEVRHAAVIGSLARARGGQPVAPEVRAGALRSLEAMALENAVEGCVRETYGALVGRYQAAHAADPDIRSAMSSIAMDEARHAALSWKVHLWAMSRLDPEARGRIARAQAAAIVGLTAAASAKASPAITREAGLPTPDRAACMLQELRRGLWG
jgi:hypothetical protein